MYRRIPCVSLFHRLKARVSPRFHPKPLLETDKIKFDNYLLVLADNRTLPIALGIGIFLALGFSGFTYVNMNSQVQEVKASLEEVEEEKDKLSEELKEERNQTEKLKEDIEEKEEKIETLKNKLDGSGEQIRLQVRKYERLLAQSKTLGECLEGVVNVINAMAEDEPAEALLYLASVAKECEEAEEIMENLILRFQVQV